MSNAAKRLLRTVIELIGVKAALELLAEVIDERAVVIHDDYGDEQLGRNWRYNSGEIRTVSRKLL